MEYTLTTKANTSTSVRTALEGNIGSTQDNNPLRCPDCHYDIYAVFRLHVGQTTHTICTNCSNLIVVKRVN